MTTDLFSPTPPPGAVRRVVQRTPEWERINALPRRVPGVPFEGFARELTARLRRPGGTQELREIQAWALFELYTHGGLLGPIRVGHGKTLVSLLAPLIVGARRPLLLLPAALIPKTERERRILAVHWRIPNHIRLVSYEALGRIGSRSEVEGYSPDLIIADEAHKLRNRKAAVTKRVSRYMREHPDTKFVALSGTLTSRSLKDYHHLADWALGKAGSPLPNDWGQLVEWADTLDESFKGERPDAGALLHWSGGRTDLDSLREGYRARLVQTPGVIVSQDSRIGTSLQIRSLLVPTSDAAREAFRSLRGDWLRPDGEPLVDGAAVWSTARQLALGFWYRWEPPPPLPWRIARREWARICREILSDNRRALDSELQVRHAVRDGMYPGALTTLQAWDAVVGTYRYKTVPVWLDSIALDAAAVWARDGGIIWTEHTAFARELAKCAKLPYYGPGGVDGFGRAIESHDPREGACIASIDANGEGRNLQSFNRNLIISLEPNGKKFEQCIARTHRDGQAADTVTVDIMLACREHNDAWDAVLRDSAYVRASIGHESKALYADVDMTIATPGGPAWE